MRSLQPSNSVRTLLRRPAICSMVWLFGSIEREGPRTPWDTKIHLTIMKCICDGYGLVTRILLRGSGRGTFLPFSPLPPLPRAVPRRLVRFDPGGPSLGKEKKEQWTRWFLTTQTHSKLKQRSDMYVTWESRESDQEELGLNSEISDMLEITSWVLNQFRPRRGGVPLSEIP